MDKSKQTHATPSRWKQGKSRVRLEDTKCTQLDSSKYSFYVRNIPLSVFNRLKRGVIVEDIVNLVTGVFPMPDPRDPIKRMYILILWEMNHVIVCHGNHGTGDTFAFSFPNDVTVKQFLLEQLSGRIQSDIKQQLGNDLYKLGLLPMFTVQRDDHQYPFKLPQQQPQPSRVPERPTSTTTLQTKPKNSFQMTPLP